MDQENIDYLNKIASRVQFYFDAKEQAVAYIHDNNIYNRDLAVHIVFMSAVWAASKLGDNITQDDFYIFCGVTPPDDSEGVDLTVMKLHPSQTHLTLEEIFDLTVEGYK